MQAEAVVAEKAKGTYKKKLLKDIVATAVGSVLIVFTVRFFCVSLFLIPSPSMKPTLVEGDHIAVNLLAYGLGFGPDSPLPGLRWWFGGVERGDVVVFTPPVNLGSEVAVKRATSIPGDKVSFQSRSFVLPAAGDVVHLHIQDSASWLYSVRREGVSVHFHKDDVLIDGELGTEYTFKYDHFFMTGDNASESYDSRQFGTVLSKHVLGKAVFIYWSSNDEYLGRTCSVIQ